MTQASVLVLFRTLHESSVNLFAGRSKKIRCDGFRPCCTQCAQVGFECKTSDKLSRRAFPRGYTESLEERVRSLESEVHELKDLLDAKDEKIDLLSKVQSQSMHNGLSSQRSSFSHASPQKPILEHGSENGEVFRANHSNSLRLRDGRDPCFAGPSSSRAFAGSHPLRSWHTMIRPADRCRWTQTQGSSV